MAKKSGSKKTAYVTYDLSTWLSLLRAHWMDVVNKLDDLGCRKEAKIWIAAFDDVSNLLGTGKGFGHRRLKRTPSRRNGSGG